VATHPPSEQRRAALGQRLLGCVLRARLALGVVCAGAASGCDGSSAPPLELWAAGREGEVVSELMPEFEARHPGLRVHVQQLPFLGAHEKLLTAVVGGSPPDLAPLGNTWLPEFAMIGAIDPLDDVVASSSVVRSSDYFEGVWSTNRYEGRQYGVPWYVDTRVLFYRRDLLREAGFEAPPSDWAGWLAMLEALQQRFVARGENDKTAIYLRLDEPELLIALAQQTGEPLLRDGYRRGNFRGPGFRRALELYVDMFKAGLAPQHGMTRIGNLWDEFAMGNFIFYVSGPWQLGELERRLPPELADSWATAPLPGASGPGSSLALGSSLVVFSGSKQKAAAWSLIEYLSEPAVQQRFYGLTGDLPPRRESWASEPLASDRNVAAFRAQVERMEPTAPVPEWERILKEVAIISERAARGALDIEAAVTELDARADRILEKRRWILERTSAAALEAPR
jgi:multiple sugar transport system substrate-binding protein